MHLVFDSSFTEPSHNGQADTTALPKIKSSPSMNEEINKLGKTQLKKLVLSLIEPVPSEEIEKLISNIKKTEEINQVNATNPPKKPQHKVMDMSKYRQRHIALHVQYNGRPYAGFASQDSQATVEQYLFAAFERSKLIVDRKSCSYSRCGRTDKGVSAFSQVIALKMRSNIPLTIPDDSIPPHLYDPVIHPGTGQMYQEIDYITTINKLLPTDIRILAVTPVTTDFSARFSCTYRQYQYYFYNHGLNTAKMQQALDTYFNFNQEGPTPTEQTADNNQKGPAQHNKGQNFQYLCKMDVLNVTNFHRQIRFAVVRPADNTPQTDGQMDNKPQQTDGLWVFEVRGEAFLWHMVRCLFAVLLLIGREKEGMEESLGRLLAVEADKGRPCYNMASSDGLMLVDCGYEIDDPDAVEGVKKKKEEEEADKANDDDKTTTAAEMAVVAEQPMMDRQQQLSLFPSPLSASRLQFEASPTALWELTCHYTTLHHQLAVQLGQVQYALDHLLGGGGGQQGVQVERGLARRWLEEFQQRHAAVEEKERSAILHFDQQHKLGKLDKLDKEKQQQQDEGEEGSKKKKRKLDQLKTATASATSDSISSGDGGREYVSWKSLVDEIQERFHRSPHDPYYDHYTLSSSSSSNSSSSQEGHGQQHSQQQSSYTGYPWIPYIPLMKRKREEGYADRVAKILQRQPATAAWNGVQSNGKKQARLLRNLALQQNDHQQVLVDDDEEGEGEVVDEEEDGEGGEGEGQSLLPPGRRFQTNREFFGFMRKQGSLSYQREKEVKKEEAAVAATAESSSSSSKG